MQTAKICDYGNVKMETDVLSGLFFMTKEVQEVFVDSKGTFLIVDLEIETTITQFLIKEVERKGWEFTAIKAFVNKQKISLHFDRRSE